MKAKTAEVKTRRLMVLDNDGPFQIDVPEEAKVTFGPALPMSRKEAALNRYGEQVYALRIYKGATERAGLLAVFPGVYHFYDVEAITTLRPQKQDGNIVFTPDNGWFENRKDITKKLQGTIQPGSEYIMGRI